MKRLIITEKEKKRILILHKNLINEQDETSLLSATKKLEEIEKVLKLTPDAVIDRETTDAILEKLNVKKNTDSKKQYACVVNHSHVEIIDYDDSEKLDYQIGDLVFSLDGTYIDLSPNTGEKFTYTCEGDIINSSKHGYIRKDMYPMGSDEYEYFNQQKSSTTPITTQSPPVETPIVATQTPSSETPPSQSTIDTSTMTKREFRAMEREKKQEERKKRREEIKKLRQDFRQQRQNIRRGEK